MYFWLICAYKTFIIDPCIVSMLRYLLFLMVVKTMTISNTHYSLNDIFYQSGMNVDKQVAQLTQRRDKLVPKLEEIHSRVRSADLTKVPAHVRQQMDSKVGHYTFNWSI